MADIQNEINNIFVSMLQPGNARSAGYLGMSMIGGCPAAAYDSFMGTREADRRLTWYGFAGRAYEDAIYNMLRVSSGFLLLPKGHYAYHIEAKFDSRYRGHADVILVGSDLESTVVDVKSLGWHKFENIKLHGQLPSSHGKNLCQVQAYMHHGHFDSGSIIYTPRDIPYGKWEKEYLDPMSDSLPFHVVEVEKDLPMQIDLDKKAVWLLELIDRNERPVCTCRFCPESLDNSMPI